MADSTEKFPDALCNMPKTIFLSVQKGGQTDLLFVFISVQDYLLWHYGKEFYCYSGYS